MLPRAEGIVVMFDCVAAHLTWRRAVLRASAHRSFVAAQFSILPRTVACGRAVLRAAAHPWCHARQNASSSTCCRTSIHASAQFYVRSRTHGATCSRTLRVFAYAAGQWFGLL